MISSQTFQRCSGTTGNVPGVAPPSYWPAPLRSVVAAVLLAFLTVAPGHGQFVTNTVNWDLGSGRHGSLVLATNTTIEQLYSAVRLPADPVAYNALDPNAVPHFVNFTITNGATLTVQPWNGTTGGVIVVKARGRVVVAAGAAIDVSGAGYRGGAGGFGAQSRGYQGESFAGTPAKLSVANYGGGAGGSGQWRNPNYAVGHGGGGGFGTAGADGSGYPNHDGIPGPMPGGIPYGDEALTILFMGSGGGGGGGCCVSEAGRGGTGGNGAGAVSLTARTIQIYGAIRANGGAGTYGSRDDVGWGGGGSGGGILLRCIQGELGSNTVVAVGGKGNSANATLGGFGRIRVESVRGFPGLSSPSASVWFSPGPDTDEDGIPDSIEIGYDLDSPRDTDSDGIPDFLELDSDNNGVPDSAQLPGFRRLQYYYDRNDRLVGVEYPNGSATAYFYDGNDNLKRQFSFSQFQDYDGLPALWKALNGLNPTNSDGLNGIYADADGDGWSNVQEWKGGSSPTNWASIPTNTVQTAPLAEILPAPNAGFGIAAARVRLADGEGNQAVPLLQYSNEVSVAWRDATIAFLDGTNYFLLPKGVAAPPAGAVHELGWDTAADLGGHLGFVSLRTSARDGASTNLLGPWSAPVSYLLVLADADSDGLLYHDEIALGTDPMNPDSDRDGVLDGTEVHQYGTNPLLPDTDGDTITDAREILDHTNPTNALSYVISFRSAGFYSLNAGGGICANGLVNGTFTLGQGCPAGDNSAPGLQNSSGFQAAYPMLDTDGDGLPDDLEYAIGTNPFLRDSDGDGMDDFQEWLAGTNPNDPASSFRVAGIVANPAGEGFVITWDTVEGRFYTVSSATSLPPAWAAVYQVLGDGTPKSYVGTNTLPQQFFRINVTR